MRRTLVASLALFVAVSAPAAAQTCLGLASHASGRMQVTGNGSFAEGMNTVGGSFGYGLPASVFGSVGVGTTSIDALDGSSLDIGANVGYQLSMGKSAQAQVCPIASFGMGMGPNNILGSGFDESSRRATLGVAVGTSMDASPRMKIAPNAGLALAYGSTKTEDASGSGIAEGSDTYGLASLGVGIILNSNISVRPRVDIPLGLDGSDPTFGLTLGFNFGRKHQ